MWGERSALGEPNLVTRQLYYCAYYEWACQIWEPPDLGIHHEPSGDKWQ